MANQPQWRYAYPVAEFLGGSKSREVMAVGYVSDPHGIPFEVRIPKAQYLEGIAPAAALAPQTIIETLLGLEGVADVSWDTTQTPSGALRDQVTIYVTSTSGESQDTLVVPVVALGPQLHAPQILALRGKLDAAEGA